MRFSSSSSSSSSSTGRRRRKRRSFVSWVPWLLLLFFLLLFLFLFFFQADLLARSRGYANSLQNGSNLSRALEAFGGREKSEKDSVSHLHEHHPNGRPSMPSFCEAWLEAKDKVIYSRNFSARPIVVGYGENEVWETCAIGCEFKRSAALHGEKKADAVFGLRNEPGIEFVLRSMESSQYYPDNDVANARRKGFTVVMTTSLASDVPVGYFSWTEYDLMAPPKNKTQNALAAAFISNCGGHTFRLHAITKLREYGVSVDSYGTCLRNKQGHVSKLEALRDYKFSLAFENSYEDDYVTEKFWQSLVAGSIPVVIGAANIYNFVPSNSSILYIKTVDEIADVAKQMLYLATHEESYNASLSWKYEGPSEAFKALIDMASVHSSCRLCIHLGTKLRTQEEKQQKRPCQCKESLITTYHLYIRERGKFEMESIFLRSNNMTLAALHNAVVAKFSSMKYVPIFKSERPKIIQGDDVLRIYRIYPVGMNQREALYTWKFQSDDGLKSYIEKNPCAKLEVIFV